MCAVMKNFIHCAHRGEPGKATIAVLPQYRLLLMSQHTVAHLLCYSGVQCPLKGDGGFGSRSEGW